MMPTTPGTKNLDLMDDAHAVLGHGKPVYAAIERLSPFRKPDWRWQRAKQIVEAREPLSVRTDDAWTRKAAKYLKKLAVYGGHQDIRLCRKMPDIAIAHQLSQQVEIHWMTEARLLSQEPIADVAQHSGVDPAAIVAFEKLFFDVLDRLKCADYIAFACFGPKYIRHELTRDDKDILLRMFGYFGGPIILDYVAPYILTPGIDLSLISQRHAELGPKIRRMLAMETTRFDWPTDKKSRNFWTLHPPTLEDVQEMMVAAVEKGSRVLRPVKSKQKVCANMNTKPDEPDEAVCLVQSVGACPAT
jgi:hypothetical protein